MAKPRETAKPDPPVESEEEEEEESGEEEEEGSSSDSEPETPQNKPSSTPAPAPAPKKPEPPTPKIQPTPAASSSSEDEESGSDTDSDSHAKKIESIVKPIASKPMDEPQKTSTATKKPRSKPNSSGPTSPKKPTTGAGSKRPPAGGDEGKDAKRSKKKSEAEIESSEKKGNNSNEDSRKLFQRLWSEDDEIAILKGMLDYSAKKKADPVADLNDFHEFIKKNLHIDFSRTQLQDKIRRLRRKYENNADKERKGNKERTFSKPHEQKAYDWSKKVWGKEKNGAEEETTEIPRVNGSVVKKSRSKGTVGMTPKAGEVDGKAKEVKDLVSEKYVVEGLKNVNFGPDSFRIEEWVLKNGMDLIKDSKKRAELEEKWRELKVKEIELLARRSELMAEQTKLILDGLK